MKLQSKENKETIVNHVPTPVTYFFREDFQLVSPVEIGMEMPVNSDKLSTKEELVDSHFEVNGNTVKTSYHANVVDMFKKLDL